MKPALRVPLAASSSLLSFVASQQKAKENNQQKAKDQPADSSANSSKASEKAIPSTPVAIPSTSSARGKKPKPQPPSLSTTPALAPSANASTATPTAAVAKSAKPVMLPPTLRSVLPAKTKNELPSGSLRSEKEGKVQEQKKQKEQMQDAEDVEEEEPEVDDDVDDDVDTSETEEHEQLGEEEENSAWQQDNLNEQQIHELLWQEYGYASNGTLDVDGTLLIDAYSPHGDRVLIEIDSGIPTGKPARENKRHIYRAVDKSHPDVAECEVPRSLLQGIVRSVGVDIPTLLFVQKDRPRCLVQRLDHASFRERWIQRAWTASEHETRENQDVGSSVHDKAWFVFPCLSLAEILSSPGVALESFARASSLLRNHAHEQAETHLFGAVLQMNTFSDQLKKSLEGSQAHVTAFVELIERIYIALGKGMADLESHRKKLHAHYLHHPSLDEHEATKREHEDDSLHFNIQHRKIMLEQMFKISSMVSTMTTRTFSSGGEMQDILVNFSLKMTEINHHLLTELNQLDQVLVHETASA